MEGVSGGNEDRRERGTVPDLERKNERRDKDRGEGDKEMTEDIKDVYRRLILHTKG